MVYTMRSPIRIRLEPGQCNSAVIDILSQDLHQQPSTADRWPQSPNHRWNSRLRAPARRIPEMRSDWEVQGYWIKSKRSESVKSKGPLWVENVVWKGLQVSDLHRSANFQVLLQHGIGSISFLWGATTIARFAREHVRTLPQLVKSIRKFWIVLIHPRPHMKVG